MVWWNTNFALNQFYCLYDSNLNSGSIEMNDSSRAVSFEQELRGSSLSSDEGNINDQGASGGNPAGATVARSLSVETGNLRPSSPRQER